MWGGRWRSEGWVLAQGWAHNSAVRVAGVQCSPELRACRRPSSCDVGTVTGGQGPFQGREGGSSRCCWGPRVCNWPLPPDDVGCISLLLLVTFMLLRTPTYQVVTYFKVLCHAGCLSSFAWKPQSGCWTGHLQAPCNPGSARLTRRVRSVEPRLGELPLSQGPAVCLWASLNLYILFPFGKTGAPYVLPGPVRIT